MHPTRHFRAFERRRVQLDASLRSLDDESLKPVQTVNVGLGGVCIELEGPAPLVGSAMQIEIMAPNLWDPLVLRSEVVWYRDMGGRNRKVQVGMRFVATPTSTLYSLFELLFTQEYE